MSQKLGSTEPTIYGFPSLHVSGIKYQDIQVSEMKAMDPNLEQNYTIAAWNAKQQDLKGSVVLGHSLDWKSTVCESTLWESRGSGYRF